MSYPPYPQQPYPQQYGYNTGPNPDQLLGPARAAGIMMIIVGVLLLLLGGCMAAMLPLMTQEVIEKAYQSMVAQNPEIAGQVSPEQILTVARTGLAIFAGVSVVLAIVQIVLGVWTRGGSVGAVMTSLIVNGLLTLGTLILLLLSVSEVAKDPSAAGGLVVLLIPGALLATIVFLLFRAKSNAHQLAAIQQQWAAWQYQQQMQQPPPQQYPNQYPPPPPGQ
jgi:hypothetical protein